MNKYPKIIFPVALRRNDGERFQAKTEFEVLLVESDRVNLCEVVPYPGVGRTICGVQISHEEVLLLSKLMAR